MLERAKWLTIMIMIAGMVMGAQAAIDHFLNTPVAVIEPTHPPTLAPSATPAPTDTSTPTRSNRTAPGINITDIIAHPPGGGLTGEVVLIENTLANPVDLSGWSLRDDQKNTYNFPPYLLGSGQTLSVWSRTGVDTTSNLYWNLEAEVWNDGHDCAYLRDSNGKLQSYVCY